MPVILKDTLPMTQSINELQEIAARKHGIPVFKGKLFKHEGTLDQNLDKYGRPIFNFVNSNTVVIGGAITALQKLFYNSAEAKDPANISFMPKTLNEMFDVNANVEYGALEPTIKLFGVGVGGCGLEFGTAYDPDFKMTNMGDLNSSMIPFRVSPTEVIEADASGKNPANYFFRKKLQVGTGDEYYAWYLKEFSDIPKTKSLWQDTIDPNDDGAPVTTLDTERNDLIECFGECVLTITEDDLREFYLLAGNLQNARFNQIGLYTGVKKLISGMEGTESSGVSAEPNAYYDYVGVRLFSVVNFDNVSVKEPSNNVYIYRIYAAV